MEDKMIPILYSSSETNFTANGIGWLSDCSNCIATEALNGVYECEFSYPITGRLYSEIFPDRIIKAKPSETSNPQLFKIYRSTKPINGIVKFYCQPLLRLTQQRHYLRFSAIATMHIVLRQ